MTSFDVKYYYSINYLLLSFLTVFANFYQNFTINVLFRIETVYIFFIFSFRYLHEIGYTDTIIDIRSNHVRSLLGLHDAAGNDAKGEFFSKGKIS